MAIDEIRTVKADGLRRLRADDARVTLLLPEAAAWCGPVLVALGLFFVLFGGADSELGPVEARIGLSASEAFNPLGQTFGRWRFEVWPLRVAVSRILYFAQEPGRPESGTVLWPAAVAGMAAGWIVARRMLDAGKIRLALLFGFAWFGSVALVDHSSSAGLGLFTTVGWLLKSPWLVELAHNGGLDLVMGLTVVAALDRLLSGASDLKTGTWAALAFLSGGWPPLVVIVLAILVLGRRDADFSYKLILPPMVAATAWLVWTSQAASIQAAAAALALPLTRKPDWTLGLEVALLGLPLSPFALLMFSPSMRSTVRERGSKLAFDWMLLGLAAAIGGTIIPGLATACRVVALLGLLVAAAAALEAAWCGALLPRTRRLFLATVLTLTAGWMTMALYGSFVMTINTPYYRPIGVVILILSLIVSGVVWWSVESRSTRRSVAAMLMMTVCLKLCYWGYFIPEWNYRYGQGPWGRAVGQWLLPNWTLYTTHDWPEDLAWTIGRPVRQLESPQHIEYPRTTESRHALLLESEYENWPANAPKLVKVATFSDPFGSKRILARTEGTLYTPSGRIVSRITLPNEP